MPFYLNINGDLSPTTLEPTMTTITTATAATSTLPVAHWVSKDGQGSMPMEGAPASECLAELLGQCADAEQRADILAGRFELATPTEEQVTGLRAEAAVAGDLAMVAVCDRALDDDEEALGEVADALAEAAAQ